MIEYMTPIIIRMSGLVTGLAGNLMANRNKGLKADTCDCSG